MKAKGSLNFLYIFILVLIFIVFIRTIIDLTVEYKYPTMDNVNKKDENLVSNLVFLKHILDVPYGLIIIYLLFNVTLNAKLYFVISLSILSILIDYLFDKRYIYNLVNKKYLNESVIKFIDIYLQSTLDYVTLAFYLYVLYYFI